MWDELWWDDGLYHSQPVLDGTLEPQLQSPVSGVSTSGSLGVPAQKYSSESGGWCFSFKGFSAHNKQHTVYRAEAGHNAQTSHKKHCGTLCWLFTSQSIVVAECQHGKQLGTVTIQQDSCCITVRSTHSNQYKHGLCIHSVAANSGGAIWVGCVRQSFERVCGSTFDCQCASNRLADTAASATAASTAAATAAATGIRCHTRTAADNFR